MTVTAESMILEGYEAGGAGSWVRLSGEKGSAGFLFPFPTGRYDIDIVYLAEQAGQNTFSLYIGSNQVVSWLGKDRDDRWHRLSEQKWHAPRHIRIDFSEEVRIEGLSSNGSLAIFDSVVFSASKRSAAEAAHGQAPAPRIGGDTDRAAIPAVPADWITVHPGVYELAFKNPLKGFRHSRPGHEYGTLIKTYFRWNDLESSASGGVDAVVATCSERWKGFAESNVKAVPRVYLDWPKQKSGWPSDLAEGDYTSDAFKERILAFIQKLAEAWDTDPRVAYVEMGLIGEWGEHEFPDTRDDIKDAIAARFAASFKNKLVMIRWPHTYGDHLHNFGYYWDSFAHHDQEYYSFLLDTTSPRWQTAVIGGETAYDWGNDNIQPGTSPDVSLGEAGHRDYIIDRIRRLHVNHLGWIADYDRNDAGVRSGAELVQKALGYRFELAGVSFPRTLAGGGPFPFTFAVKNVGSSPFYYNWPVEASLLDPVTREPVWKSRCSGIDIRTWLPGDRWDPARQAYAIPAEQYRVNQSLELSDIPSGAYIFALAILDPAGDLPCARFATANYFRGGRHPFGLVGVGCVPGSHAVSGFDDLQDDSLHYDPL